TVSLSFCPERALPWPLRGVQRWDERKLLRVNHTVLRVDQALACLDFIWGEARLLNRLVDTCLIQEALAKDPAPVADADLQHALDAFRGARRLCKADDCHRWMAQHGLTQGKLERLVADKVRLIKLRERVTADRVEGYFAQHASEFDTAQIVRLDFADEASAH